MNKEAAAKRNVLRNEKGFTLIEIIAVLVILGILAAVAVPKFIDLQTDATNNALKGALAEGMSTMSLSYASLLLSAGEASTAQVASRATSNAPVSDDFSYTFSAEGVVSVTAKQAGVLKGKGSAQTKAWKKQ